MKNLFVMFNKKRPLHLQGTGKSHNPRFHPNCLKTTQKADNEANTMPSSRRYSRCFVQTGFQPRPILSFGSELQHYWISSHMAVYLLYRRRIVMSIITPWAEFNLLKYE